MTAIKTLDFSSLLNELEQQITQTLLVRQLNDPLMIGVRTGGVWVAEQLHHRLLLKEPLGLLDISFYRDDFSQVGLHPNVKPSHLPFQVEGRNVILVDDVFWTGRTTRAALNEIFDYGRPNHVILAVLVERDGKQIPLAPDCVGTRMTLALNQRLKLTGPEPLGIVVQTVNSSTL